MDIDGFLSAVEVDFSLTGDVRENFKDGIALTQSALAAMIDHCAKKKKHVNTKHTGMLKSK